MIVLNYLLWEIFLTFGLNTTWLCLKDLCAFRPNLLSLPMPASLFTFHGNHDLWQFGYFEKELGVSVHAKPIVREFNGKRFFIGHGDGLGPRQHKFKFTLGIYRNYFFQRLFAFFHPSIGIGIANWFSKRSKLKTFDGNFTFYGEEEFLINYCRGILLKEKYDYLIFGHRHLPLIFDLGQESKYVNLGDWIGFNSYAVFDGRELKLETWVDRP